MSDMKFCVNCEHYSNHFKKAVSRSGDTCLARPDISMTRGTATYHDANLQRALEYRCGESAKWFVLKAIAEEKAKPVSLSLWQKLKSHLWT